MVLCFTLVILQVHQPMNEPLTPDYQWHRVAVLALPMASCCGVGIANGIVLRCWHYQ